MEKENSNNKNKIELKVNISNNLSKLKDCIIDNDGIFKYIQIKVICKNENKILIRGWRDLEYHKQNFLRFQKNELSQITGCLTKVLGGGRIEINSEKRSIFIYGYSKSYGKCDHEISSKIIQKEFPEYSIKWSDEGY